MTEISHGVYVELEQQLIDMGYFKRSYGYYALLAVSIVCGAILSIYILFATDNLLIQLCNAIFLAFVMLQGGVLAHDFSHSQVFENKNINRTCAIFAFNLVLGLSEGNWNHTHNAHHKYVNRSEYDPDLAMPFIFGEEQVEFKKHMYASLRPYQHFLFFIVLPFVYPIYIIRSLEHVLSDIHWLALLELSLMVIHYVVFFGLIFFALPLMSAFIFSTVWSLIAGMYMALVFAPNHKGMPMVAENQEVEWWHQIVCTRNLYPYTILFHMMGGLNYQIEHHLFPTMPRSNYPKVSPIVKKFCNRHNLTYHETTWTRSMKDIYSSLKEQAQKKP
ncbi:acyl-CoA desaturase [Candidatus Pacebacteria bacterium]|nr:acyl-CoA desaturase [Candidatus Paceibacterota bacterium]